MYSNDYNSSSDDRNDGVICNAVNCHYNRAGNICTAEQIKVGNRSASCPEDTECDTFMNR